MSSLSWQCNDCPHSTHFVGKKDKILRGSWTAAKMGSEFLQRGPERVKVMSLLQWRCKDIEDVSSECGRSTGSEVVQFSWPTRQTVCVEAELEG